MQCIRNRLTIYVIPTPAGSLVYVFFGTIKEVSIGPTSLMALLTLQYTIDKPPEYAVLLAFLAGCVELLMGVLRLGFIVDFISTPVTNAFTSATSLIIIGAQLKNLLGLRYSSKGFVDSLAHLVWKIGDTRLGDGVLGLVCCVFLLALRVSSPNNQSAQQYDTNHSFAANQRYQNQPEDSRRTHRSENALVFQHCTQRADRVDHIVRGLSLVAGHRRRVAGAVQAVRTRRAGRAAFRLAAVPIRASQRDGDIRADVHRTGLRHCGRSAGGRSCQRCDSQSIL